MMATEKKTTQPSQCKTGTHKLAAIKQLIFVLSEHVHCNSFAWSCDCDMLVCVCVCVYEMGGLAHTHKHKIPPLFYCLARACDPSIAMWENGKWSTNTRQRSSVLLLLLCFCHVGFISFSSSFLPFPPQKKELKRNWQTSGRHFFSSLLYRSDAKKKKRVPNRMVDTLREFIFMQFTANDEKRRAKFMIKRTRYTHNRIDTLNSIKSSPKHGIFLKTVYFLSSAYDSVIIIKMIRK